MTTLIKDSNMVHTVLEDKKIQQHHIQMIEHVIVEPSNKYFSQGITITCNQEVIFEFPFSEDVSYYNTSFQHFNTFCETVQKLSELQFM